MSADEALALSEDEHAAFELALVCGLTRRNGPLARELEAMPTWRRWAVRKRPMRARYRTILGVIPTRAANSSALYTSLL